jgi:hypothetical protein
VVLFGFALSSKKEAFIYLKEKMIISTFARRKFYELKENLFTNICNLL